MGRESSLLRGAVSGAVGGLVGAVVMGWFMSGPGNAVEEAIDRLAGKPLGPTPHGVNSSLVMADALSEIVAGQRLTSEQRAKAPKVVHLTFSVLTGGCYGALNEIAPPISGGLGSAFGAALFAVGGFPALVMGKGDDVLKPGELGASLAAHVVYGVSTELSRRLARPCL